MPGKAKVSFSKVVKTVLFVTLSAVDEVELARTVTSCYTTASPITQTAQLHVREC